MTLNDMIMQSLYMQHS